jgi:hypothetical protein
MGLMGNSALRVLLFCTASHEVVAEALSGAMTLLDGDDGLALDFTDDTFLSDGFPGSAAIVGGGTGDGYNSSPDQTASSLLTYTSPSPKMVMGPDGLLRFGAQNLFLNSAAPANQGVTVVSGATYAVILTGSVTTTLSGAATGTITAGTTNITAATTTLTFGSTSGTGTIQVTRTPADLTYLATAGAIRFGLPYEWDTSGELQGTLVEEQRTNLVTASNSFTGWTNVGSTDTAAQSPGPDGLTSMTALTEDSATSEHSIFILASGSGALTQSIYVKANGRTWVYLQSSMSGGSPPAVGDRRVWFDLTNAVAGTVGAAYSSAIISNIGGGIYRISAVINPTTYGSTFQNFVVGLATGDGVASYAGDGSSGVFIYGAQLEAGSFPTSYIQTFGSTVTRAADSGLTGATSLYPHSATVGTAIIEYVPKNVAAAMVALRLDDNTANEVISVGHSAAAAIGLTVTDGGAAQTAPLTSGTATANAVERIAVSWKADDFLLSDNGATAVADTSGTLPTVTTIDFGPTLTGYIRKVVIKPIESSAAEVEALATP